MSSPRYIPRIRTRLGYSVYRMSKKVLVFQELLMQYASIAGTLSSAQAEAVTVENGRDALEKARDSAISVAILDVAMPQMSGIEGCRQIKEGASGSGTTIVILHSAIDSGALKQRAMDAGCDAYVQSTDGEQAVIEALEKALKADVSPPSLEEPSPSPEQPGPSEQEVKTPPLASENSTAPERVSPRVEIPGPMTYFVSEEERVGESINASMAGLLIGVETPVAVDTSIRMQFEYGESTFMLQGTVIRAVRLKSHRSGLPYAIGVKFSELDEAASAQLRGFLRSFPPPLPKLQPVIVRGLMEQGEAQLIKALQGEAQEIVPLIEDLLPVEKDAFSATDETSEYVRRIVVLRTQCIGYRAFIPVLQSKRGSLAGPFLPYLRSIFEQADQIEDEIVEKVRDAVQQEDEQTREILNEVSNRLYESKVELVFSIDEKVSSEGLGPESEIIESIKERAKKLRELQQYKGETVTYARRSLLKKKEEEKKKEKKKTKGVSKKVQIITIAAGLTIIVGISLVRFLMSRVSQSDLKIPIEFVSAKVEENGLLIFMERKNWAVIPEEQHEEIFDLLEAYLKEQKLRQAKIMDEQGKYIAALLYGRVGRNVNYERRVW